MTPTPAALTVGVPEGTSASTAEARTVGKKVPDSCTDENVAVAGSMFSAEDPMAPITDAVMADVPEGT